MRKYIQRGSVSNRMAYANLREDVWNEVYSLDKEGVVLHDNDIQCIAMTKAKQRNLPEFKVIKNCFIQQNCEKIIFFPHIHRQATVGCITSRKNTILLVATLTKLLLLNQ